LDFQCLEVQCLGFQGMESLGMESLGSGVRVRCRANLEHTPQVTTSSSVEVDSRPGNTLKVLRIGAAARRHNVFVPQITFGAKSCV